MIYLVLEAVAGLMKTNFHKRVLTFQYANKVVASSTFEHIVMQRRTFQQFPRRYCTQLPENASLNTF